jgi:hypothetical protein
MANCTEGAGTVCRNIHALFNYDPPATEIEIHEAALQYVRKVSGYRSPSVANEAVFVEAVRAVSDATARLLDGLVTHAAPKNRDEEAAKARERAARRFG